MARSRQASRPYPWLSGRVTRRTAMGAGAALALTACTSPLDDSGDATSPPEPTPLPEATQAAPTPTQPPIASPVPGYLDPDRWFARSLVVATAGEGDFAESMESAFFQPFSDATGATVRHQSFGREGIENLIDQVDSGDTVWDVVLVPTGRVLPLAQTGYLEPIDYAVVDPTALFDAAAMQHGIGAMYYSTVMVSASVVEETPSSWADFWDLDLFGGTRALRRYPVGTLEFALLADGVAMNELYPLDIPRAFDALDRIQAATIFYEDGTTPVELVRTGQVGLASAWNVRSALPDVTSLVDIQWQGGMVSADSWVIPRSAENLDVAMSFINYATRAVPSANFSRLQPFGPANMEALELLLPAVRQTLPTAPANLEVQFFENWAYWAGQEEELVGQFEDWLLNPQASPEAG